jgi:hypothetical protein
MTKYPNFWVRSGKRSLTLSATSADSEISSATAITSDLRKRMTVNTVQKCSFIDVYQLSLLSLHYLKCTKFDFGFGFGQIWGFFSTLDLDLI